MAVSEGTFTAGAHGAAGAAVAATAMAGAGTGTTDVSAIPAKAS